jgi:predicted MPP superfamily phosphohydrolase
LTPIVDPRDGDAEDDTCSTKRRSLMSLAGSLLAEISLPKLAVTWVLLVGLPGLLLGAAPLLCSLWLRTTIAQAANLLTELAPLAGLVLLASLGWLLGRPLLRLLESSFWSLNALAILPVYVLVRETVRHVAENWVTPRLWPGVRRGTAAFAGVAISAAGGLVIALVWPATRWIGTLGDLAAPLALVPTLLANGTAIIFTYFAGASLVWGIADAAMDQPRDLPAFAQSEPRGRTWRIAHLSDLHTVGERFGFRIECGRDGPQGNDLLHAILGRLAALHAEDPLDVVLITGDLTDAGRSTEWAEFFAALAEHPTLADRIVALPGNHDVNVVDRRSPARMELPMSPMKRLRQLRMLSALAALHGSRLRVVRDQTGELGASLDDVLRPHNTEISALINTGALHASSRLAGLWPAAFPLVQPPETPNGLGILVLNSNAETHFSFTNALGLVASQSASAALAVVRRYPDACWIVALHHHLVEYPRRAKALSERIGTAVINGSWFVRRLRPLVGRAVIMHGHRHIDWIGACGGLLIVSAPSPVMGGAGFYIHELAIEAGQLRLLAPTWVAIDRNRTAAAVTR